MTFMSDTAAAPRISADAPTLHYALGRCSLGSVLVAGTAAGICAVLLGDETETLVCDLRRRFPRTTLLADAGAEPRLRAVIAAIEHPHRGVHLPLAPRGTAFQHKVWDALRAIAPGATATYAEIAARIGLPRATRAVAQACGANPIAVLVPCHRVVRSDGALSGYRWGIERKQALLAAEGRA